MTAALAFFGAASASAAGSCSGHVSWAGSECSVDTDGSSVNVEYTETHQDSGSNNSDGGGGGSNSGGTYDPCLTRVNSGTGERCAQSMAVPPQQETDSRPSLPTSFSVSDILAITPETASLHMEPNGWGIVGQPVNFWVDATTHSVSGSLLEQQVQVQFRPVGVRWDFGDGNGWSTESLGASWAELGLAELSDTATSHRYTEKAEVTVTATISYAATVNIAGASIPVTGTVTALATTVTFELFEQSTVLVPNP